MNNEQRITNNEHRTKDNEQGISDNENKFMSMNISSFIVKASSERSDKKV
jgi:hypothetical protein